MAKADAKAITAFCPACDTRIRFDGRPKLFDIVSCPECEEEFEVIGLSPVRLDWPSDFTSDDDWPDDENDDYDFDD